MPAEIPDLDWLEDLARETTALAMRLSGHVAVEQKGDRSPVTEADRACQQLVTERARAFEPDPRRFCVLGEEETPDSQWEAWPPEEAAAVLVVDPIDGTAAYTRGLPFWGVSLAIMVDAQPVAGVVHMPLLGGADGWLYRAARGQGATRNGIALEVSKARTLDSSSQIAVPSAFFQRARLKGFEGRVRSLCSMAHHISLVAAGEMDAAFVGRTNIWDIAGAACILAEAGGALLNGQGQPPDWPTLLVKPRSSRTLYAGTPATIQAMHDLVRLQDGCSFGSS